MSEPLSERECLRLVAARSEGRMAPADARRLCPDPATRRCLAFVEGRSRNLDDLIACYRPSGPTEGRTS